MIPALAPPHAPPQAVATAPYADRWRAVRANDHAGEDIAGAGYGAASRLYSAAATNLGMTPATYGKGGAGADITYAVAAFDIGHVLLAATATGVCFLGLDDDPGFLTAELRRDFPAAELARDDAALAEQMATVAAYMNGGAPHPDLPLDIRWTAFQHRVWRAITTIPPGQTRTYQELAATIGAPGAARAVGTACARNPVSLVVPCHRAVGSDGALRGYRWGLARKRQLLRREGVDM